MKIEDFFEIVDPFMRLQHSYNKSKKHSMQMSVVRKCNTKISEKCNLLFPFYSPFSKRIVYSPQNLQTYNSFTVVWRLYLFVKLWQEILPQSVSSVSSRVLCKILPLHLYFVLLNSENLNVSFILNLWKCLLIEAS